MGRTISCQLVAMLEAAVTEARHIDLMHVDDEQKAVIQRNADNYEKVRNLIADGSLTVIHDERWHENIEQS